MRSEGNGGLGINGIIQSWRSKDIIMYGDGQLKECCLWGRERSEG